MQMPNTLLLLHDEDLDTAAWYLNTTAGGLFLAACCRILKHKTQKVGKRNMDLGVLNNFELLVR